MVQGNSVKLGREKSCFYEDIVLKSCGVWVFQGITYDFCSCSSMSPLCNISAQFLFSCLSVAMLQAQDSTETLREKACSKMKAFVFPWVSRAACFLTAKGQVLLGQPLSGLNFPGFPSCLAQILLLILLPTEADACASQSVGEGESYPALYLPGEHILPPSSHFLPTGAFCWNHCVCQFCAACSMGQPGS